MKKNFDDMNNRLDRIPARDGQTDRRTDFFAARSEYRAELNAVNHRGE